jgi:hypothetical protein
MKKSLAATLALFFIAISLSGCFFPGRYHDRGGYVGGGGGGGGYDRRPEGGDGYQHAGGNHNY